MSWQVTSFVGLTLVLVGGAVWYERTRPSAKMVAMVAALAALAIAGRLVFAPVPNVVATTDIVLFTGYAIGGAPGFAVGALAALVSNFWLGQGPWTPWQMGGWGLVGIAGAVLARVSGRRLGRLGLAFWCGLAGLAYGALLDLSVMVTYGGEQSLDRYLALAARGLPFNAAHAAGNVIFALIAGPALVRMLLRFRERIEVDWRPLPLPAGGVRAGAALGALLALAAATTFLGGAPDPARAQSGPDAVAYLRAAQNSDGGFGASPGASSSVEMTGWVALGLESAGINPLDLASGGKSAADYLRANAGELDSTGDLERTILVLSAAGLDPSRFAGHDLVEELIERRNFDGSYEKQVNLTAFAVLALGSTGIDPNGRNGLVRSAAWLRRAQGPDGGWGLQPGAPSDADTTAGVLQALAVGGGEGSTADGVRFLRRTQQAGGGWALASSGPTNSQSTSWAVQGLLAAGVDPSSVRAGGKSPLDYLGARQTGDGHFRYSSESDQTPVWVTAEALLAVEGAAFPLAVVAASDTGSGEPSTGGGGGAQAPSGGFSPGSTSSAAGAPDGASGAADGGRGTNGSTNSGDLEAAAGDPGGSGAEGTGYSPLSSEPEAETATDEGNPGAWIAAAFGAAALAMLGGFLWYRRRLP